jgi:hypothetical protein
LDAQKSHKNERTADSPKDSCTDLLFGDGSTMKY